jgi:kynurenine formamidase
MKLIDLSQEIYPGMPVYDGHPQVTMTVAVTHEQREGIKNPPEINPVVHAITLSEHTGTHIDAPNHFARQYRGQSVDKMPLEMFYTEGICVDLSHKRLKELIEVQDIEAALTRDGLDVKAGDTVLLCTDHFRKYFGTAEWNNGPGISAEVARWFGNKKVAAFGVETRSPGIIGVSNKEVHLICGEMGYSHYENLVNLHLLVGKGHFRFIAFPLRIRGGTGSPVRAVAVIE